MDDTIQSTEVSVVDIEANSTGLELGGSGRPDAPFWISATNGAISTVSLLSQTIVILIAKGLEGDYSAKTLMWVQAACETLKRLFNTLVIFQKQIRKKLSFSRLFFLFPPPAKLYKENFTEPFSPI